MNTTTFTIADAATKMTTLNLFFATPAPPDFVGRLRAHLQEQSLPNQIRLLATPASRNSVAELLTNVTLRRLADDFLREGQASVHAYVLTRSGFDPLGSSPALFEARDLISEGMAHIFTTRQGLLSAGNAYHYGKPSGRHSRKFLRTGNVFMESADTTFIAAGILHRLTQPPPDTILLDTAAIAPAAHALTLLAREFYDPAYNPTIASFGSYDGIAAGNLKGRPTNALVLISATTSAKLEGRIREHGFGDHQIHTLFYVGKHTPSRTVICNLATSHDPARRIEAFDSYEEAHCIDCRAHIPLIEISGDAFLPESPRVEQCHIALSDAPSSLAALMEDLTTTDAIVVHRLARPTTDPLDNACAYYIDLAPALNTWLAGGSAAPSFKEALQRRITQSVSATTKRIIHLSDDASRLLAQLVKRTAAAQQPAGNAWNPPLVDAATLRQATADHVLQEGSSLVVAASIGSGRDLLAVSQALRNLQENRAIQYLIGIAGSKHADEYNALASNLIYGETGQDYDAFCIRRLGLPRDQHPTAWAAETDLLRTSDDLCPYLKARLGALETARTGSGLPRNQVFLSKLDGTPLTLRRNFTFWRATAATPQSEVAFTVATILHQMRTKGKLRGPSSHTQTVLSAQVFTRFNDGVVQAALLRNTIGTELDYSGEQTLSIDIENILRYIGENRHLDAGEAWPEFLLAIALRRLRLAPQQATTITSQALTWAKDDDNPALIWLATKAADATHS